MAVQYWVGDFFVDCSRNQITHNQKPQTLAPKAMAVLTYLAENQGQVVSQETLLDAVWKDTAVTPNTLQRSIAQLRKALGDDGKVQHYIKTHAKQGYSLESDVRWSATSPEANDQPEKPDHLEESIVHNPRSAKIPKTWISILASIVILGLLRFMWLDPNPPNNLIIEHIRSLTATDDKEFDPTYTPDGQYIVFHRYLEKFCVNKLWAKNMQTQVETQLIPEWGNYGRHSFSPDGKQLVFLATEVCDAPVCYNLVGINFEQALGSPQEPHLVLQCKNSVLEKPVWISQDHIALMQMKHNRWKLIRFSISENRSSDLYEPKEATFIDFTYSPQHDLIAVTTIGRDGHDYLEMLQTDGQILSSHRIERPADMPKHRNIFPTFDPLNEQLIFTMGRHLFTLSYEGKVQKITAPFADRMFQPVVHPQGNRVLMLKGPYDSDIVLQPLDGINQEVDPSTVFERSILGEDHAMFQPGGDLIAFWSERSGSEQIWISDGSGAQQLSQLPMDSSIWGMDWAEDGNSILANVNGELTEVNLDRSQKAYPLSYPVAQLYQWQSEQNTALIKLRIGGKLTLVECNLNTLDIQTITDQPVLWAQKSKNGQLITKDHLDQFWRPGPVENQRIQALEKQGSKSKSFILSENTIYGVNAENQLWSYDLDTEIFQILTEVSPKTDYLTDINQTHLLMTIEVSAKKEIFELTLGNKR